MTLHHLEVLCAVCRVNSMTEAAKRLNLTQPAVSRAIKELEIYYGVRIFDRINRRIFLTQQGEQMWRDSEAVLSAFEEMEQRMHHPEQTAELQIGCGVGIGTALMTGLIRSFNERYPNCKVHTLETASRTIQQLVATNDLDFALIEGGISEHNLHREVFYHDRLIPVCATSKYDLYKDIVPIGYADLAGMDLLLPARGYGTRELLEKAAMENNFTINPVWSSSSHQNLLARAIQGDGVAILSQLLVKDEIYSGSIVEIPARFSLDRNFSIVWHRNKRLSAESRFFIQLCHELSGI